MSETTFTPEERVQAQQRLDATEAPEIRAIIAENEKRYVADPNDWLTKELAKCEKIGLEMRSSARGLVAAPVRDGKYDLQSVEVRSI